MSETDDTDALLTCDPGGGINDLLGKTMDDVCSLAKLDSSGSPSVLEDGNKKRSRSSRKKDKAKNKNKAKNKSVDTSLDVSDYFNSEGELVLSGLSQLSETTYEESSRSEDGKGNTSGENGDYSSDQSSNTTSASNTVVPSSSKTQAAPHEISNGKGEAGQKIQNNGTNNEALDKHNAIVAKIDRTEDVPAEIQSELRRQLVQANSSNPEAQSILENNASHISYGVLNLNLNDLKTFAEGLSLCSMFPQSPRVNNYVPSRNDKGEQVFVRAPNFRTPGGYKPPKTTKKCRDLTDEQIQEEVRKMYAFPDLDDDGEKVKSENIDTADMGNSTDTKNIEANPKVDFNFLDGTPIPSEFGKGKCGKPIKRKLIPNGGNICGGTVGSIPDLGFGLRSLSSDEAKEPLVEKSVAWTTGKSVESSRERNAGSSNTVNTTSQASNGFSFGFGEADSFSPIKPANESEVRKLKSSLLESQRMQPSPETVSELKRKSDDSSSKVLVASPALEVQIQSVGTSAGPLTDPCIQTNILSTLKDKTSLPKRRLIKKAATKHRGMTSPRPDAENSASSPSLAMESIASDLEKILSEIDTNELESLIENFDESDVDAPGTDRIFDGIETLEGNLVDALSQLNLDSLQNSAEAKFSEKFHDERIKREKCEKELRILQEHFLAEKQQNAVLEGTLKRRNVMLMQITVAFNRVCKEWKKFDAENKAAVSKLQHDQKILAAACKHSRERISDYEKELHKTLEMADLFKTKLNDVQNERDESIMLLKETNSELEEKIAKLKQDMDLLRNERDATLRALREAQIKLDEGKFSIENMESHIKTLEDRDLEYVQKYEMLLQAKSQQDNILMELTSRKNELENTMVNLRTELELEKSSKEHLKKTLQEDADRKNKLEAERLHEYYNKKVQEILKAATQEASSAESLLKDQMKKAAIESERRLAECKERYLRELDSLKVKYETEIEKLKRENLHKQLLISSTVKQLQLGESTNHTVNPVNVQPSRASQNRDILEVLKAPSSQDTSENIFKGSGVSNLTRFTLDHLPSIVPIQTQLGSTCRENGSGQVREAPFEIGRAFVRYKTSTPIDASADPHNKEVNASGDFRRSKSVGNQVMYLDETSKPGSEKVCSEKLVNPSVADFKNVLCHFLEAPVKPEKELPMNSLFPSVSDTGVDPALQKCIQELVKSYSDKLNSDSNKNVGSSTSAVASVQVGVGTNNNAVNKNENEFSNDNSDSEKSQQCSSTSDSQFSSRSDVRKSKSKAKSEAIQQTTSQVKPAWK